MEKVFEHTLFNDNQYDFYNYTFVVKDGTGTYLKVLELDIYGHSDAMTIDQMADMMRMDIEYNTDNKSFDNVAQDFYHYLKEYGQSYFDEAQTIISITVRAAKITDKKFVY